MSSYTKNPFRSYVVDEQIRKALEGAARLIKRIREIENMRRDEEPSVIKYDKPRHWGVGR